MIYNAIPPVRASNNLPEPIASLNPQLTQQQAITPAEARPTTPAPPGEELERHDTIPAPPWLGDVSETIEPS